MNILITGCAGFIGSHVAEEFVKTGDIKITGIDSLTYAGSLKNIELIKNYENFKFIEGDITNKELVKNIINLEKITHIINFAAETHVDNSIKDVFPFIHSNVIGVASLIDAASKTNTTLIHISTDEVYGVPNDNEVFTEKTSLNPKNPYASTKAAGDHLIISAINTYKLSAKIIRPSNNFGPRQHSEKLIPTIVRSINGGKKIPIYGDGKQKREWTLVKDTAKSIKDFAINLSKYPDVIYNLSSENQLENLEIIKLICHNLGVDFEKNIEFVADRPGHDKQYKISNSILFYNTDFQEAIKNTV